jgi:hypothetical protein
MSERSLERTEGSGLNYVKAFSGFLIFIGFVSGLYWLYVSMQIAAACSNVTLFTVGACIGVRLRYGDPTIYLLLAIVLIAGGITLSYSTLRRGQVQETLTSSHTVWSQAGTCKYCGGALGTRDVFCPRCGRSRA